MNAFVLPPAVSTTAARPAASSSVSASLRASLARSSQLDRTRTEKMKSCIKLLLVDDHPLVRRGISSCLARQERFVIVGEAADGLEAVRKAKEILPDIILMDIDMPLMNGLAATELLHRELPNVKVLILSMHSNTDYVLRIMRSGAHGYVLKEASLEELLRAIETVESGEAFFSPDVARVALNQFVSRPGEGSSQPTNREREVLIHIAQGLSNKEIASALGVGVRTVETHREHIMRKLNIHSVAGLTKFAISKGLIVLREVNAGKLFNK